MMEGRAVDACMHAHLLDAPHHPEVDREREAACEELCEGFNYWAKLKLSSLKGMQRRTCILCYNTNFRLRCVVLSSLGRFFYRRWLGSR